MSDFDTVLERLLVDGPFRAALAADPAAALAGYRLGPDEVEVLRSQVSPDSGGERTVETRTSKSSLFGMFGSVADAVGKSTGGAWTGAMPPHPPGVPGHGTLGAGGGPAAPGGAQTVGQAGGGQTLGHATGGTLGQAAVGHGTLGAAGDHTPVGYHPHIDADGDGHWDRYTAVQHADGGVDIYVDRDHDGRIDFIGHDRNHDGRVESADYDENFNGTFETYQRDTNGDGWLDTRTVRPDPPAAGSQAIGERMPSPHERFGTR